MNKADRYMYATMKHILEDGYKDVNPRPKYSDGTPAHTYSVNGQFREYNVAAGEFPLCTLRPIAIKTGINEILAIFQNQSNKVSEFERMGCKWWDKWELSDGTIGKSYPYNMESHRPGEMERTVVAISRANYDSDNQVKLGVDNSIDTRLGKIDRPYYGVGYLGDLDVKNFTDSDMDALKKIWENMLFNCYKDQNIQSSMIGRWQCFTNFLRDIRYVPQYFLARESGFEGWTLYPDYYGADCYSKTTCAFVKTEEAEMYEKLHGVEKDGMVFEDTDNTVYRLELSRNQVVERLKELKENPYGRRHIISFWHWANINQKSLVECAYETIWNVRNKDNIEYLDLTLVQRSGDSMMASCSGVNECQYVCLLMMFAQVLGYKPGMFYHMVANEQLYDHHIEPAKEIIRRYEEKAAKEAELNPDEILDPKFVLNSEVTDFFDFTLSDFTIENYVPTLPQLKLDTGI